MRTGNTTWQQAVSTPPVNTASPKEKTESAKNLMLAGQRETRAQYRQAAKQAVSNRGWVTPDVASQRLTNIRSNPSMIGANRASSRPVASNQLKSSAAAHALPERTIAMRGPRMGGTAPAGPKPAPQTSAPQLLTPDQELDLLLGNDRSFDGVEALLAKHENAQARTDSVKLEGGELGRATLKHGSIDAPELGRASLKATRLGSAELGQATLKTGTARHEEELGSKPLPGNLA